MLRIGRRAVAASTGLATGLALLAAGVAPTAEAVDFGGNAGVTPNANHGCEARPSVSDAFGNFSLFGSNQPSCSYFQVLPFGANGAAPASRGRVTLVRVRTGSNPAPLRFTVMQARTGITADGKLIPNSTQCCFGERTTRTFRMRPNSVNVIPLNLPMRNGKNLRERLAITDYVGFSASSGQGTLPIFVTQRPNVSQYGAPGNPAARALYPEIRPGQVRVDSADVPSYRLTTQFTFCTAGNRGRRPVARAATGRQSCGGRIRSARAVARNGKARLRVSCVGSCRGTVQLLRRNGEDELARPARFFSRTGRTTTVTLRLNRAGKRATKGKRQTRALVRVRTQGARSSKVIRLK